MTKKTVANLPVRYFNDVQLIEILLTIHAITKGINLRDYAKRILKYYIKYGYTDEAEQYIIEDYLDERRIANPTPEQLRKINQSVRTANVELRDLGYLNHGTTNLRKSKLSDEMEQLRERFLTKKEKHLIITFNNG